jgi:hypothetical protein
MALLSISEMSLISFIEHHVTCSLSQRELKVANGRFMDVFGIGENTKTLTALGAEENLCKNRIMQITERCRRKVEYSLHLINQRMKDPHVIVKHVPLPVVPENLPIRQKFVQDLGAVSVRTYNCLSNSDLLLLDKLLEKTEAELLQEPNFGRKSLNELKLMLSLHGLKLKSYSDYPSRDSDV